MKKILITLLFCSLSIQIAFGKNQWSSDIVVEADQEDYIEFRGRLIPNDWHSGEALGQDNTPDNKGNYPKGFYYPQMMEVEYVDRVYPVWKKFAPTPDLPNPIHNHGVLVHGRNPRHDLHTYDHSQVQILEDGSRISMKDTVANPTQE